VRTTGGASRLAIEVEIDGCDAYLGSGVRIKSFAAWVRAIWPESWKGWPTTPDIEDAPLRGSLANVATLTNLPG